MQSGFVEQLAEHTMQETAAGIKYDTMRRTLEAREQELLTALGEQKAREVELVEQRERAEEEIVTRAESAKQMKSRRDEAASTLQAAESELDQYVGEDKQSDATVQERLKQLGDRLHESSLARRAAEAELEQRERALQNLQTKTEGARDSLTQEKQQLFRLKVDTKEEMLSQVLEETMKAQEAFLNKEQVDRALNSMRAELTDTQATTESLRREMLKCVSAQCTTSIQSTMVYCTVLPVLLVLLVLVLLVLVLVLLLLLLLLLHICICAAGSPLTDSPQIPA
jgi:chromosome segregation ATPase